MMKLSDRGLAMIREFEGYHRRLPDGNCIAYRCPAGVWTIGHGVTVGVKAGMIWTPKQAEEALQKELEGHELAVLRFVKVDLNQNQFDALVSFAYNCGNGALEKSTLLKKLNRGDFPGAQAEFMKWNKGGGRVLRGLSIRRAKEAALFAERVEEQPGDPLPQAIDEPVEPMKPTTKAAIASAATGTGTAVVASPPAAVTDTVANVGAWQNIGKTAIEASTLAWSKPWLLVVAVTLGLGVMFWSDIRRLWA